MTLRGFEEPAADSLALEIGRVVMWAAAVDEICSDLAVEFQRSVGSIDRSRAMGRSGSELAAALRAAGASNWADEYSELCARRNDVVHGRWAADGVSLQLTRTLRGGSFAGAYEVTRWNRDWLRVIASDLASFYERARAELFERIGFALN